MALIEATAARLVQPSGNQKAAVAMIGLREVRAVPVLRCAPKPYILKYRTVDGRQRWHVNEEIGIHRHGQLDGRWRDCVIVERLLGNGAGEGHQ
jgi:hypothetical protein